MPYFPNSPEALAARAGSLTASNTCRGITQNGTPCKRALKSPHSSPSPSPGGVNAEGFCFQHKIQYQVTSPLSTTLKERNSIDTLAERLGLLEIEQRRRRKPLPKQEKRPGRREKPKSDLGLLCCVGEADEARRAPRPTQRRPTEKRTTVPGQAKTNRPNILRDPPSKTVEFLAVIPPSTAPDTTALLLGEMAKPVSEHDDEGYIYMFWLTPETLPSNPPSEAAKSLLAPPTRQSNQRRTSDVINTFASNVQNSNKKTILLKIGRAQNVQRRLNQWTRQCGYNLSLIRYYPYMSSTLSSVSVNEPPRTPSKVANVHKVERLIHIELSGKKAVGQGKCGACGKEHREWFEVEASRNGVKAVDEVVRRWVEWGEKAAI